jgi:hypothetical protein
VRVVSWLFVLCALAAATGVFMPCLEPAVVKSQRATISLYDAGRHRAIASRLIAAYHKSHGRELAELLTGRMLSHLKNEYLGDAHDAMTTLDDVSDQDIRRAGTVLVVAIWLFIVLHALAALLVLGQLVGDVWRRRRLLAIVGLALADTAIGVGLYIACKEAAFQVNDEVGARILAAGPGPLVMAAASVVGLASAIAVAIGRLRQVHASRR